MIDGNKDHYSMEDLLALMKYLRSDAGCPWDREQTHQSIKKSVIEEAYEVVDAIDSKEPARMEDELGDLLLQVVFHAQMAGEAKTFDFSSVVDHLCKKLISRHSHLFGEKLDEAGSPEKVLDLWERNKKTEKKHQNQTQAMKEIPRVLPALQRAYKIQKKAKQAGFDWDDRKDVLEKIREEADEVEIAARQLDYCGNEESTELKKNVEMEIGDLLFAVVNYARFMDVEPEIALDSANHKFIRRFEFVEKKVLSSGNKMEQTPLAELDRIWNEAKEAEKSNRMI